MARNPERRDRGGDVEGSTKTDNDWGVGEATTVAEASYDPGYPVDNSLPDTTMADVKQGYTSYGVSIGDGQPKGMIGSGGKK
jgi:hypothetical protein